MKTTLMSLGAAAIFLLSPVAAYADCKHTCTTYCGQQHPDNPWARAVCQDGCMVGCDLGPTEPTV